MNRATIKFMSTCHPRVVWLHVQMWRVGANRNRRGLKLSPVADADFDILKELVPEELITNCLPPSLHSNSKLIDNLVVDFLPFCLLTRLMLETSLKGILRLNNREKLAAQRVSSEELEVSMMRLEMDLMSQFGKFDTH